MNSFEEKALNKELAQEGLVSTKIVSIRNYNQQLANAVYITLEYQKSIYTTYVRWDRLYKEIKPNTYLQSIRNEIGNEKERLDSIEEMLQNTNIHNRKKAYNVCKLVESQLDNLSTMSQKGFYAGKFRKKNRIKIEKMIQKGAKPIEIIQKFKNEYGLHDNKI